MARRQIVAGAILCAIGAPVAVTSVGIGGLLVVMGGLLTALGVSIRRSAAAAELVNPALDAITRGDLLAAEVLLDQADRAHRASHVQRVIASQRALIAWRRGDLDGVERRTSGALSLTRGWLNELNEEIVDVELHSQRALARAAAGNEAGARQDIEAVLGSPKRSPTSVARATLAEALVLERRGDRAALRAHLAKHRTLLLHAAAPHEREMARALIRLARAKVSSAYREPVAIATGASGEAPAFEVWLGAVAPAAAPFATPPREALPSSPSPPPATAEPSQAERARYQLRPATASRGGNPRVTLALWVVLILMFAGIWTVLPASDPVAIDTAAEPEPEPAAGGPFGALGLVIAALVFVGVGLWIRRLRRSGEAQTAKLQEAEVELVRGDVDGRARDLFERLANEKAKLTAAHGELGLAKLAHRDARFDAVLTHCDRGIELVTSDEGGYVSAVDLLLPNLAATRAAALAALRRFDEAHRETAAIAAQFPTYPMISQARVAVDLVEAAIRGDAPRALAAAERVSSSMPLCPEHATLAGLARAVAADVGADEREDLREELRQDPRCQAWVEAVAPGLFAQFRGAERPGEAHAGSTSGA